MWNRLREACARVFRSLRLEPDSSKESGTHNLFEAAAVYVSARAVDDQERVDEASGWVSPEALSFGVSELACRAVLTLAREREESPQAVARALLGLPTR